MVGMKWVVLLIATAQPNELFFGPSRFMWMTHAIICIAEEEGPEGLTA